jgi:hypothetical protein
MPYLNDKTKWPYKKDVSHWNNKPSARHFMLFAALAGDDNQWFELWKSLDKNSSNNKNSESVSFKSSLLWIDFNNKN